MKPSLFKLEGCGNDFLLSQESLEATQIRKLCDRHFGVGADGLVVLTQKNGVWKWQFFNQDGSEARFCGNAARCVALWLSAVKGEKNPRWSDRWGHAFEGREVEGQQWQVHWGLEDHWDLEDIAPAYRKSLEHLGHDFEQVVWVQAGVPHVVLMSHQELPSFEQRQAIVALFRPHGPEGSNVTFASRKSFQAVSFERGVEAETLACGSGAAAASLAYFEIHRRWPEWSFPGGPLRIVEDLGRMWLQGPARIVFEAKIP